jgi:subtilisin family serine protease
MVLLSLSIYANFDNSKLFIKTNNIKSLPQSKLIKSVKHLFNNNYIVSTSDAVELQKILKNNKEILDTQKNYKSIKSVLPKEQKLVNSSIKSFFNTPFNDPQVDKIWSFNDGEDYGVSVNKYFLSPLSREKTLNIVAVVDTGVDYKHEDLKDVMWKNKKEIPGNKIDDDANGYIDDVYGIDTLDKDEQGNATGDPMASHAHGTHVAGTIGAKQNNNIGIAGISSSARIMAIRTVPDSSDETDADIVESFLYAAKHGAKLINCSFGKKVNEGGNIVNETITHIGKEYGVLTIAAAGNDSSNNDTNPKYPASFDSDYLLVIASTNKGWFGNGLSSFSNYGKKTVDVAAPGSRIFSTVPGNSYSSMSGTSMASPTAAGVASEVLANFPSLTPLQLKKVMMESTIKESKFQDKLVSSGRVDLANAIQYTLENFNSL